MLKQSGKDVRSWTLGIALTAFATLLSGLPGTADARTNRADGQSAMQNGQQQHRQSDFKKITGTVKRIKNVELKGQDRDNLVVQLRTKNGQKKLIDLGNAEELEDIDIQKGDRITAWGRSVNIGDKHVFMAHKLRAKGESIDIDRQQMSHQWTGGQASHGQRPQRSDYHSQRSNN